MLVEVGPSTLRRMRDTLGMADLPVRRRSGPGSVDAQGPAARENTCGSRPSGKPARDPAADGSRSVAILIPS